MCAVQIAVQGAGSDHVHIVPSRRQYFFFNRVLNQHSVHMNVPLLAHAPRASDRLILHRRVERRLHQHDVVGPGQVDADPSSPQCQQKDFARVHRVEFTEGFLALLHGHSTDQGSVHDAVGLQHVSQTLYRGLEVCKNQEFVVGPAVLDQVYDLFDFWGYALLFPAHYYRGYSRWMFFC